MSTEWLIDYYEETFRLQPDLKSGNFRRLIEKDYNYKSFTSFNRRVRTGHW